MKNNYLYKKLARISFITSLFIAINFYANAQNIISLNGKDTVKTEVYFSFIDSGAKITDSLSAFYKIRVSGTVDTAKLGFNPLSYFAVDTNGNYADTVTRIVEVADTKAPVIKLIGPKYFTIRYGDKYTDSGYVIVSDNYWPRENIIVDTLTNFKGDGTDLVGGYFIRYTATDGSGNKSYIYRLISIGDGGGIAKLSAFPGEVNIFPNPAENGVFKLDITLENPGKVKASIFNILGKEITQIENNAKLTQHILPLDVKEKSGVYFVRVQTGNAVITKQLILRN